MKKLLIFLLFSTLSFAQDIQLESGDLIFQNLSCGPLCDAINAVTSGYDDLDFNHMGLVTKEGKELFVIEASGKAVRKVRLDVFLNYTNAPMYVGRLKPEYKSLIPKALEFAHQQIGMPYDDAFLYDNGKYYCSELVYDAFKAAYKKPFFALYPMTYKIPNSTAYFPVWISYFNNLKTNIPEGELGCNPGGMSKDEKIDILGILK